MNATVVRTELALGEDYQPWLDELASIGPPPTVPRLPEPEGAATVLARLEVPEGDLPEIVAALPSPGRTNILRFQRRFHLVPGAADGDSDVFRFAFKRTEPSIEDLPQRSTLERAVVSHLRYGRHWQVRTGWFRLDG